MLRAKVKRLAENRFVLIKFAAHVHVLRALAGEEKHGHGASRISGDKFLAVEARERSNGFALVFENDGAPMRKRRAPDLAGESSVGKVQLRMLCEMRGQIRKSLIGGGFGFCGNGENLVRPLLAGKRDCRRFFQDHVRIGAADAERSNAGAARHGRGRPIGKFAAYIKWTALKLDVRIDFFEV